MIEENIEKNIEENILNIINKYRIRNNKITLTFSNALNKSAKKHAKGMSGGNEKIEPFSQAGAIERFNNNEEKYINIGENLARIEGYNNISNNVFNGWKESKGHNKNMLGPFNKCGIGIGIKNKRIIFITLLLGLTE